MNEFVIMNVHLAEVLVQIVQVLVVHVLLSPSNGTYSHIHKVRARACQKLVQCNAVDILNGMSLSLQHHYCTSPGEGSRVTPRICPLTFLALSRLFCCCTVGAFGSLLMGRLFRIVG